MNKFLQEKIIFFRNIGLEHFLKTTKKMNDFTISRNIHTFDEIWFVEHYPIFTQGQLKKKENITVIKNIPIITTDRGGQITYHGPGQQILYFLIDIKRRKMTIRELINIMEKTIIDILDNFSIKANVKKNSPGVYVDEKKICSLGLRIKKGSSLHGLALNVNMNLIPFNYIVPCGDINIQMTQIKDFNVNIRLKDLRVILIKKLSELFKATIIHCKYKRKINTYFN